MPKKKKKQSFYQKNRKIIWSVIIAVLVLVSFGSYRVWLTVHFLVSDDLVVFVDPQDISINAPYTETTNVTISVNIENNFFCDATCDYRLRDISNSKELEKDNFTNKLADTFERTFSIQSQRRGVGQALYSFEVQCQNIRTSQCLTDGDIRKRTTFITLQYDLPEEEKLLKKQVQADLKRIVQSMHTTDVEVQRLQQKFAQLAVLDTTNLQATFDTALLQYEKAIEEVENLLTIWETEDYRLLATLLEERKNPLVAIQRELALIEAQLDQKQQDHNALAYFLNGLDAYLRDQSFVALAASNISLTQDHHTLLTAIAQTNANSTKLNETFTVFRDDMQALFSKTYLQAAYYNKLEKQKLCEAKGTCLAQETLPESVIASKDINYSAVTVWCNSLDSLEKKFALENNKSSQLINTSNKAIVNETASILENNLLASLFLEANATNSQELQNIATFATEKPYSFGTFTQDEIIAALPLHMNDQTETFRKKSCASSNVTLPPKTERTTLELNLTTVTSNLSLTLTENHPVCCAFGECNRCCTDDMCNQPELYPVLFLHGHAFNSDSSPQYTLDGFNQIETKLEELGYVSAGSINPASDITAITQGEWSLTPNPLTIKGSYYLISYYSLGTYTLAAQKSENIETYAIRMKELIDLIQFRTGKDKVVVVAHSMGGLVARSYTDIFGSNAIEKLIMIGTPNQGVTGQAKDFCPVLGEKKECEDMAASSIFIQRLNDPNKQKPTTEMFNIVGTGCNTNDQDGDGVVTKESATLEEAEHFFVEGTCSGLTDILHVELLDIERYPEVFEILTAILKQ